MMKLWSMLGSVLDTILPRRERRRHTEERTVSDIPLSPTSYELLGVRILSILNYREPAVEDLLRSLKYDHSLHAARLCAELLEDYLREEISSIRSFSARRILLVPVPLHKDRLRERGFNQIEIVLQYLPPEFHDGSLASVVSALLRVRATKQQTHLSREKRIQNVAGAFELSPSHSVKDVNVILIDDVVTTGATLVEAGKPFVENSIPVTLLALARA